jgi:hypothetical protein
LVQFDNIKGLFLALAFACGQLELKDNKKMSRCEIAIKKKEFKITLAPMKARLLACEGSTINV